MGEGVGTLAVPQCSGLRGVGQGWIEVGTKWDEVVE